MSQKILCLYPRYNFLILFHLPAILPWFISYSFKIAIKIINYLYISQIMMNLTERKSLPMKRLRDYFQGLEYSDPSCLLELQELVEMSLNEDWWPWNQKDTRQLFHVREHTASELSVRFNSMNQHFWAQNIKIYHKNNKKMPLCQFFLLPEKSYQLASTNF